MALWLLQERPRLSETMRTVPLLRLLFFTFPTSERTVSSEDYWCTGPNDKIVAVIRRFFILEHLRCHFLERQPQDAVCSRVDYVSRTTTPASNSARRRRYRGSGWPSVSSSGVAAVLLREDNLICSLNELITRVTSPGLLQLSHFTRSRGPRPTDRCGPAAWRPAVGRSSCGLRETPPHDRRSGRRTRRNRSITCARQPGGWPTTAAPFSCCC